MYEFEERDLTNYQLGFNAKISNRAENDKRTAKDGRLDVIQDTALKTLSIYKKVCA